MTSEKFNYGRQTTTEVTLELTCPNKATSEVSLLVYTFLPSGQVVGDRMTLKVDSSSLDRNFLNISLSQQSSEPGGNVTLTLATAANSIVALRGVDQSILLLSEGTDITQKRLDDGIVRNRNEDLSRSSRPYWDDSNSDEIFDDSGLTILTNREVVRLHSWKSGDLTLKTCAQLHTIKRRGTV